MDPSLLPEGRSSKSFFPWVGWLWDGPACVLLGPDGDAADQQRASSWLATFFFDKANDALQLPNVGEVVSLEQLY